MLSTNSITLFFIGICLGLFIGFILFWIYWYKEHTKNLKESKKEVHEYIEYDSEKIKKTFEDLIGEEFEMYSRYHVDLFQPGVSYIKAEEVNGITTAITTRVLKRITPALSNNLSLIYNFDNDEELTKIIIEKVGIMVVALTATTNSSMEEDKINFESLQL